MSNANECTLQVGAHSIPYELDGNETVQDAFETARECFNLDAGQTYSVTYNGQEGSMSDVLKPGAVVEFAVRQGRKA